MASVLTNGFSHIQPSAALPGHIQANRDLNRIQRELEDLHRTWIDLGPVTNADNLLRPIADRVEQLQIRYVSVLETCAEELSGLKNETGSQAEYYFPLMEFFIRAQDSHTILPFQKYVYQYRRNSIPHGTTREEFHDFIGLRIGESVMTCRSYQSLLAQSLDTAIGEVDINGLVQKAFRVSMQRSRLNCTYFDIDTYHDVLNLVQDDLQTKHINPNINDVKSDERMVSLLNSFAEVNNGRRQIFEKSSVSTHMYDSIYSLEPILFFYLVNTFGNHFKAAHEYLYMVDNTDKSGLTTDPLLHINILNSAYHVAVISQDNGIGIPHEDLRYIFSGEKDVETYSTPNGILGNGKTLHTYPLIADLLRADILASSPGHNQGASFAIIIPKNLENPRFPPEAFINEVKAYMQ